MPDFHLPPAGALTAAQFIDAFYRDMPLSPSTDCVQLRAVERLILHDVPAAARFARLTADGDLVGDALRRECVELTAAVERLNEAIAHNGRRLFKARLQAGLPARTYDATARGQTATAGLAHLAMRVVEAVYESLSACIVAAGAAEDDDLVHDTNLLALRSVADALQDLFANRFRWPEPAPLLHEMQAELMALGERVEIAVDREAEPESDVEPAPLVISSLGEQAYRVGDGDPVAVTENEDAVLQAFIGMPVMGSATLKERSGNDDSPRVLRRLCQRYGKRFASAICLPGGPGNGGYVAHVRD